MEALPKGTFEECVNRARPRLQAMLSRFHIPDADAEDLLSETFVALLKQWEQVREPDKWLTTTLTRQCQLHWRRKRRQFYLAVDAVLLDLLSAPVAPPQERVDLMADLRKLLEQLPPRCRNILTLRYRGYKPAEVARELGYRESSIGKVTNRCLGALSRALVTPNPMRLAALDDAAASPAALPTAGAPAPAASAEDGSDDDEPAGAAAPAGKSSRGDH